MAFPYIIRYAEWSDAEQIAQVHVQGWQQSYQGIIEQTFLDTLSYEKRLALRQEILSAQQGKSIHLVACWKDEIVGFCDAGASRNSHEEMPGEIYAIYVVKKHQKQDVGSNLWRQATNHLINQGLIPFIVWVLEDNKPARAFYEVQGGVVLKAGKVNIGGQEYGEVCYRFGGRGTVIISENASNNCAQLL
jgi:ribosomal protein S18 acetylase RimI-like enzyme